MASEVTLKVKNLPKDLSEQEKRDFLQHFGATHVKLITSRIKEKTVAFAKFESVEVAKSVLQKLHQLTVLNSRLCVEYADEDIGDNLPKVKVNERHEQVNKKHFKSFINRINAFNSSVNFNQPPPSHLKYTYPKANRATINNIAHALASVPKFYTQVLHLMNRMNLPPPFSDAPDLPDAALKPIVNSNATDVENVENNSRNGGESSESEMESEDDGKSNKHKDIIPEKRRLPQKKATVKRPKFIKQSASIQTANKTSEKLSDVFDTTDVIQNRKIEFKVQLSSLEVKNTAERKEEDIFSNRNVSNKVLSTQEASTQEIGLICSKEASSKDASLLFDKETPSKESSILINKEARSILASKEIFPSRDVFQNRKIELKLLPSTLAQKDKKLLEEKSENINNQQNQLSDFIPLTAIRETLAAREASAAREALAVRESLAAREALAATEALAKRDTLATRESLMENRDKLTSNKDTLTMNRDNAFENRVLEMSLYQRRNVPQSRAETQAQYHTNMQRNLQHNTQSNNQSNMQNNSQGNMLYSPVNMHHSVQLNMQSNPQTNSQQIQQNIEQIQTDIQQIQTSIQQIQPNFQQIQPNFQQLQSNIQQAKPSIHQIPANIQQLLPEIQQILPSIQLIQPNIQQLQPNIQQIQPNIQQIQPNIQQIQPNIQQIQSNMQQIQPNMQQIQSTQQTQPNIQQIKPNFHQIQPNTQHYNQPKHNYQTIPSNNYQTNQQQNKQQTLQTDIPSNNPTVNSQTSTIENTQENPSETTPLQEEIKEEPKEANDFITDEELAANRINEKDLSILPVFKNYNAGIPTCRLYIKNIAKTVKLEDLEYIYKRYLSESENSEFNIRLMQEGRMKGQAFVTFDSVELAQRALSETNGYILKDKPLVVAFARSALPKQ